MKAAKKIIKKASSSISGSDQLRKKLQKQAEFFNSGGTMDPEVRIEALKKIKSAIMKYENEISESLYKDLGKSKFEAFLTEI
jgi:aldehyde dehydrogenase (NAD+)